jgi:AcrR family transcriptional regulator
MRKVDPIQHEEHRNRILMAARKLFAAQGVKETSMAQVAKACRVTKATLYHYFKGKDAVLEGIFDGSLADHDRFADTLKLEGSREETLYTLARTYMEMMGSRETMEMMKIFQTEGMKSSMACRLYNNRIKARMGRYLKMGIERGLLPDVDRNLLHNVVFTFFGSLEHQFIHTHVLKCDFAAGGDEGYMRFLARMFSNAMEMIDRMAAEGKIPRGEEKAP